jgi:hypothetical protein
MVELYVKAEGQANGKKDTGQSEPPYRAEETTQSQDMPSELTADFNCQFSDQTAVAGALISVVAHFSMHST